MVAESNFIDRLFGGPKANALTTGAHIATKIPEDEPPLKYDKFNPANRESISQRLAFGDVNTPTG